MTIELPIEREVNGNYVEIIAECEFIYHRAYRGARDSIGGVRNAGPALEPDEPAHLEFLGAVDVETGEAVDLTQSELDDAEAKAWDNLD